MWKRDKIKSTCDIIIITWWGRGQKMCDMAREGSKNVWRHKVSYFCQLKVMSICCRIFEKRCWLHSFRTSSRITSTRWVSRISVRRRRRRKGVRRNFDVFCRRRMWKNRRSFRRYHLCRRFCWRNSRIRPRFLDQGERGSASMVVAYIWRFKMLISGQFKVTFSLF